MAGTATQKQREARYRKVIVVCCFLLLFVNQGLTATSFNIYQSYIVALPDVSDVGGSVMLTVRTLFSLLAIFFVGAYYRKVSLRTGVAAATALTACGFFVYSASHDLGLFCVGSVLTGLGYGLGSMVAVTMLIGNWYRGHLGTVVGIAGMGSGAASIIMPLAVAAVIAGAGLAAAFFAEGCLALTLGVIIVALVRSKPEDMGMSPQKEEDAYADSRGRRVHMGTETVPASDKRLLLMAMVFLGAIAIVGNGYFSVLLTSSGIGIAGAAVLTAVLGAALTFSKLATGWTFDLIGSKNGSIVFFILLIAGLALCSSVGAGGISAGLFAAVLFGLGVALATTGVSVWVLELSSPADRLSFLRDVQVAYAFGGFAFNMVPGAVASATGSYCPVYAGFTVAAVLCAGIILRIYARHDKARKAAAFPPPVPMKDCLADKPL